MGNYIFRHTGAEIDNGVEAGATAGNAIIAHRSAALLDHPNESVNSTKVASGLVRVPTSYIIATSNSVNKEFSDLILTAGNEIAQINSAIIALDNLRGNNPDIAIRIDFLCGTVESIESEILPLSNFKIYFNGTKLISSEGYYGNIINVATGLVDVLIDGVKIYGDTNESTSIRNGGIVSISNVNIQNSNRGIYNEGLMLASNLACNGNSKGIYNVGLATMSNASFNNNDYAIFNEGTIAASNILVQNDSWGEHYGIFSSGINCAFNGISANDVITGTNVNVAALCTRTEA